jgi:hypothetical protein
VIGRRLYAGTTAENGPSVYFTNAPGLFVRAQEQLQLHWARLTRHMDSCSLPETQERYSDSQRLEQLLSLECDGVDIAISFWDVGSVGTAIGGRPLPAEFDGLLRLPHIKW